MKNRYRNVLICFGLLSCFLFFVISFVCVGVGFESILNLSRKLSNNFSSSDFEYLKAILIFLFIGVLLFVGVIVAIKDTVDKARINSLESKGFIKEAFDIYNKLQIASMNFDVDTIRELTTDEMYNIYRSELESLKLKKQISVVKNFTFLNGYIINIKRINKIKTITLSFRVEYYNYFIDDVTGKMVKGYDDQLLYSIDNLTFVELVEKQKKCSNCGADVEKCLSKICPSCNNKLEKLQKKYILKERKRCHTQFRLDKDHC